jgi:hypothetical protein
MWRGGDDVFARTAIYARLVPATNPLNQWVSASMSHHSMTVNLSGRTTNLSAGRSRFFNDDPF